MKDIEQAVEDWTKDLCGVGMPTREKSWVIYKSELIERHISVVNQTLETQALALEGMKKDAVFKPSRTGELYCAECGGQEDCQCETFNEALQQAVEHLRAQKISE